MLEDIPRLGAPLRRNYDERAQRLSSGRAILECAERRNPLLRRLQVRRYGQTAGRLWKTAEVDHRVPLFRVWSDHRNEPWPKLLGLGTTEPSSD